MEECARRLAGNVHARSEARQRELARLPVVHPFHAFHAQLDDQ
jgi:hypothetical protein